MPTIPKAERTVQLQALQGGKQQLASNPNAFGAGVAKSVDDLGTVFGEIGFKELQIQNETKAKEIDTEFSNALRAMQYDPQDGYYNKRGQDAYESQPLFEKSTEELYNTFMERAENNSQKLMLDKVFKQRIGRAKDGMARHSMKEYNAWIDGASLARSEDAMQEAIVNYADPKYVQQLKVSGRNEIINVGQRAGKDQEEINRDLEEYESNIHVGTTEHIMQLSVKDAREYFEANKEFIDGREQAKLLRKLKIAEKGDLATNRAHYAELSRLAAFEPEKFITLDLNEYELSDQDFKSFENKQVTAYRSKTKHDEKMSGIKRAMALSNNTLRAAGIDTRSKKKKMRERIDQFQGELLLDIQQFNKENGRAPTDQEILQLTDSLLMKGEIPGTGFFFDDEVFLFEDENAIIDIDEIPDDAQSKIRDAFQRRHKRAPTEKEIRQSYTNFMLKRK